jgi:phage shock protein PspC (stress-responsive transcriptional regulator)
LACALRVAVTGLFTGIALLLNFDQNLKIAAVVVLFFFFAASFLCVLFLNAHRQMR